MRRKVSTDQEGALKTRKAFSSAGDPVSAFVHQQKQGPDQWSEAGSEHATARLLHIQCLVEMESSLFSTLQRKNNKIRVRLQVGEDKQGRKEEEQRGKGTVLGHKPGGITKLSLLDMIGRATKSNMNSVSIIKLCIDASTYVLKDVGVEQRDQDCCTSLIKVSGKHGLSIEDTPTHTGAEHKQHRSFCPLSTVEKHSHSNGFTDGRETGSHRFQIRFVILAVKKQRTSPLNRQKPEAGPD